MKKRQRKVRLIRAAIQLVFFIFYPALFSTAFAGIKSVFQALAAHQPITWNSFLDVTGVLLVITILFGRHFCGYACAFGSLGDAMYELTLFIRQKIFHKKGRHGYPEKVVRVLQKVKYILLAFLLLSILTGWYANLQGMSPWDVFSMPILPTALFQRNREKCPAKCGLCKKRCPAHLEIDGDTSLSGECICCHACEVTCPRKNIQIGPVKVRETEKNEK